MILTMKLLAAGVVRGSHSIGLRRGTIECRAERVDQLFPTGLILASVRVQALAEVFRKVGVGGKAINGCAQATHHGAIVESATHFKVENATQGGELRHVGTWFSLQG